MSLLLCPDAYALGKKPAAEYNPIEVKDKAGSSVVWSPDGGTLAYAGKGGSDIFLLDAKAGAVTGTVMAEGVRSLCWSLGGLYALYEGGLGKVAEDGALKKVADPVPGASAISTAMGGGGILVYIEGARELSIGVRVSYGLMLYDPVSGSLTEIFKESKVTSGGINAPGRAGKGWARAGVSPADTEVAAVEYVNPPALPPYSRVRVLDYISGQWRDVLRTDNLGLSMRGSWSPDGRRLVLSVEGGGVVVIGPKGALHYKGQGIEGGYPSWNPRGSRIFIGGFLINPDGGNKEDILRDAPNSIGVWSPDGHRLALIDEGKLWVLAGFKPALIPPDRALSSDTREKLWTLKKLLVDGLVTKEEYTKRRSALMGGAEGK